MWAGTICYVKHIFILLCSATSFFGVFFFLFEGESCFVQGYQIIGSNSAKDTVLSPVLSKLFSWTELPCRHGPNLGGLWAAGIGQ